MAQVDNKPYEAKILRLHGETWRRKGLPPAWAQHRLDLVDAVPWFNQSQGGVSISQIADPNGLWTLGILLGAHTGERSYVDAEIVITSINGAASTDTHTTHHRRDAMKNTIKAGNRAVGIIFEAGSVAPGGATSEKRGDPSRYQVVPVSNMPVGAKDDSRQNCWVADYFLPTHTWPMKIEGKSGAVWMVRLEKCDLESHSWWANAGHRPPRNDQRNFGIRINEETCAVCGTRSPRMFREGFVCTELECPTVWQLNGQLITTNTSLTYTPEFLQERRSRPLGEIILPAGVTDLVPDFDTWYRNVYVTFNNRTTPWTDTGLRKHIGSLLMGFRCPWCRMLNRRVRWHEWHCRNGNCNDGLPYSIDGSPPIIPLSRIALSSDQQVAEAYWTGHRTYQRTTHHEFFTAYEFELGDGAKVAYLKPKEGTNQLANSSDYFYQKIQELARTGAVPLERRAIHTPAGTSLTNHFSVNYGVPYYFSARVRSISFQDADPVIRAALDSVNKWTAPWRTGDQSSPANELYLAGYWHDQHMNWHDDGEHGLGDVITTYTLGGQGTFSVSMKPEIACGIRRARGAGVDQGEPIAFDSVPHGCEKQGERRALKDKLDNRQITQDEWQTQFSALMKGTATPKRKTLLQIPVNHGELVIMYGPNTQRHYDHSVNVKSSMRFALTFRNIKSNEHAKMRGKAMTDEKYNERLAYDVTYTPPEDWTEPITLTPVDSRQNSPDVMPAASPRDGPEPPNNKRRRLNPGNENDANIATHHTYDSRPGPSRGRLATHRGAAAPSSSLWRQQGATPATFRSSQPRGRGFSSRGSGGSPYRSRPSGRVWQGRGRGRGRGDHNASAPSGGDDVPIQDAPTTGAPAGNAPSGDGLRRSTRIAQKKQ